LEQELKIRTATESVFRELVKQRNKTQKLLMWDLLFKTFPSPSGNGRGDGIRVPLNVPVSSSSERR